MKIKSKENPVNILIEANPKFKKETPVYDYTGNTKPHLFISEFFGKTIQGEGINTGIPSYFLRVQHCLLNCIFCDTQSVWRYGNPYSFEEIFELMEKNNVIEDLKSGVHLVLTGGSPLKQQDNLINFFDDFKTRYKFLPFIEVENECAAMPKPEFVNLIKCWNNSPKLRNSGNPDILRYKPDVLKFTSSLENSWFKFVINGNSQGYANHDWDEIVDDFLNKDLIKREQIILMPMGENQEELNQTRETTAQLAIRENVRFTDRLHITLWDMKVSV